MEKLLKQFLEKGVLSSACEVEQEIRVGAGGASLWALREGARRYVLKAAQGEALPSVAKELAFYRLAARLSLPNVPALRWGGQAEDAVFLLMDFHTPVAHEQWDSALAQQAMELCARLHSQPPALLAPLGLSFSPCAIDPGFSANAYRAWQAVLGEHPGCFDLALLKEIYHSLSLLPPVLNAPPYRVCHGDFHPENLLCNGDTLYLCDFQNLGVGQGAGDVSFFFSRGSAMGIPLDEEGLTLHYCQALSALTGERVEPLHVQRQRHASSLLTTFSFWADYLSGASQEAVAARFQEMAGSYAFLLRSRS